MFSVNYKKINQGFRKEGPNTERDETLMRPMIKGLALISDKGLV